MLCCGVCLVDAFLFHVQAHESDKPEGMTEVWEEERRVSQYAENLEQLEEGMGKWGRQIPADPSQWQCDETGVRENLWLNLSTGFIGSGREVRLLPSPLLLDSTLHRGATFLLADNSWHCLPKSDLGAWGPIPNSRLKRGLFSLA
jgi:hypothetical protein